MTVEEIAAHLRVSRWTVGRLIADGEIEAEHKGRYIFVPVDSYLKFLARQTVPATSSPLGAIQ